MFDEESASVAQLEMQIGKSIKFQVEGLYTQEQFNVVLCKRKTLDPINRRFDYFDRPGADRREKCHQPIPTYPTDKKLDRSIHPLPSGHPRSGYRLASFYPHGEVISGGSFSYHTRSIFKTGVTYRYITTSPEYVGVIVAENRIEGIGVTGRSAPGGRISGR